MILPTWHEESVAKRHDRQTFDCGVKALNEYLVRFARQNHQAGLSKTFVAVSNDHPSQVLGYYSLSAGQIDCKRVPEQALPRIGRYPIPVVVLGRLAVDLKYHGLGLGGQLLLSGGERALAISEQVGVRALAIEAKDEQAAVWYERFGAVRLIDHPLKLILPLKTIEQAVRGSA